MPTTAGAALTDSHRVAQARLSAITVAKLLQVWPLLDPNDLDATTERWLTAAVPIIQQAHGASAALARQYLRLFRAAETGATEPLTIAAIEAPLSKIQTSLVVRGPVAIKQALTAGRQLPQAASTASLTSSVAGTRHALNGGRETVLAAPAADPGIVGMVRVTAPGACEFCRTIASHSVTNQALTSQFQCHDHCHCQPAPVYG